MSCSVISCPSLPGKDLSFFNFPDSKSEAYKKWIKFCGRGDNWIIKKGYQVCELHFKDSDKGGVPFLKVLKNDAVPKILFASLEGSNGSLKSINQDSCRICLADDLSTELIPLSFKHRETFIWEMVEYVTTIQANESDLMPQYICKKCFQKIELGFYVKKLGIETEHNLRMMLALIRPIKVEKEIQFAEVLMDVSEIKVESYERDDEDIRTNQQLNSIDQHIYEDFNDHLKAKGPIFKNAIIRTRKKKQKSEQSSDIDDVNKSFKKSTKYDEADYSRIFTCLICKVDISGLKSHEKHMLRHKRDQDPPPHTCLTCKASFYLTNIFMNHKCPEKQKCGICQMEFPLKSNFSKHLHTVHTKEKLECPICQEIFKHPLTLHYHIKAHTENVLGFTCSICGRQYLEERYLKRHVQGSHSNIKFVCDLCGKCCRHKSNLYKHIARSHLNIKYYCDQCDASYVDKQALTMHQVRKHESIAKVLGKYKCDKCGAGFCYLSQLKYHDERIHLKTRPNDGRQTGLEPFKCVKCPKTFSQKVNWKRHMDACLYGKYEFHCGICHKQFMQKHILAGHMLTHGGEKKLECKQCGIRMHNKANMKRHHQTVHLQIKSFSCDLCEKKFSIKTALETHRRTHTGEKPFKCPQCEVAYGDRSTLYKHLQKVHGVAKPSISIFSK